MAQVVMAVTLADPLYVMTVLLLAMALMLELLWFLSAMAPALGLESLLQANLPVRKL